jgi:hypothetical protein
MREKVPAAARIPKSRRTAPFRPGSEAVPAPQPARILRDQIPGQTPKPPKSAAGRPYPPEKPKAGRPEPPKKPRPASAGKAENPAGFRTGTSAGWLPKKVRPQELARLCSVLLEIRSQKQDLKGSDLPDEKARPDDLSQSDAGQENPE